MPLERGRPHWWAVALGLVLVLVGVAWSLAPAPSPEPGVAPPPDQKTSSPARPQVTVAGAELPEAAPAPQRPGMPERIVIPALDVVAPIVPIRAPGGVLTPPSDPRTLGWWADGARPGAATGSALVTGHTVSTGGGALDYLEDLTKGESIRVDSSSTTTTYAVSSVVTYGKGELARRADDLFDQSVPGRLVVITCEDWNGVEYLSNVVVTARPTRPTG